MLLEEYGIASKADRNRIYSAWLGAIQEQDGAGDLAWMLASTDDETGDPYPDYDGFTFYSDADVPSICEHALQMTANSRARTTYVFPRVLPFATA